MMSKLLRTLKASFSRNGAVSGNATTGSNEGSHFYNASERALIGQHRKAANEKALAAVRRAGVGVHPKIAAARQRQQAIA